jgi:hypothetical protein
MTFEASRKLLASYGIPVVGRIVSGLEEALRVADQEGYPVVLKAVSSRIIIMGKPPALPGDAQSLTVPGICESLPSVNRSRRGVTDREAFNGRCTEFKPYGMELQVSRRMDTEVSQKGGLRRTAKGSG